MAVLTQLLVVVVIVLIGRHPADVLYLMDSLSIPRSTGFHAICKGVGSDRGESGCHGTTGGIHMADRQPSASALSTLIPPYIHLTIS